MMSKGHNEFIGCYKACSIHIQTTAINSLRPSDAYICVHNLTIIGSDNGLSPGQRQVIIWTNAGMLFIGPLRTNFSEILSHIHISSFQKIHLKMSSGKWWPFCPSLHVLIHHFHKHIFTIHQSHINDPSAQPQMLKLKQNTQYFASEYFKCIFFDKNVCILLKILLRLFLEV